MIIPPMKFQKELQSSPQKKEGVRLNSSHLIIHENIATQIFGKEANVNVIYYADRKSLMVAPSNDELFKKLHKAKQYMLKDKNAKGDKSIALHDLIIDNDIDASNRELAHHIQIELSILTVKL